MRTLKINNRHLLCVKIGRKGMGGRGERDLEPLFLSSVVEIEKAVTTAAEVDN